MQPPVKPKNEAERLQALQQLNLLDSAAEERFDRITRLAQSLFKVPFAFVSLVDSERQWFKSKQGIAVCETPRDVSFCGHAILQPELMIVSDARQDPRFADNPLVLNDPFIRFYAGAPLHNQQGLCLGTLCIVDQQPREFSHTEQQQLRDLADIVRDELLLQHQHHLDQQTAELKRSEERLAAIIEGTNIGTWEWNVQTGETRFNARWADIIGYQLSELQPTDIHTWMNAAHPDDLEQSGRLLQQHFDGLLPYYDCKARMRHRLGHWVWVHDRGRVISWSADGQPLWMSGTHADITLEQQMADDLAQQRQFLENIFNSDVIAITVLGHDGQLRFANSQAERILGLEVVASEGQTVTYDSPRWQITALDGGEFDMSQLPFARCKATGRAVSDVRHAIRWPDGTWRALSINGAPMNNLSGDEAQFVFAIQDITQQVAAEQELANSEAQFRSLVDNIPGITFRCLYDANWTMLYMSDLVDPLSGYPASDFINNAVRSYESVIHPDDKGELEQQMTRALSQKTPWQVEYRIRHADGSTRWALEKGRGVYSNNGKLQFLDGFILDITERKEASARLEHQRWLYEQIIDQAIDGFWDWQIQQGTEYLSPKLKQTLGYQDHEMANSPDAWQQIVYAEDLPTILANFDRHIQSHGAEPFDTEVRYHHKGGSTVWIRCVGSVVEWDAHGQAVRMVGCHINISQEKQRTVQIKHQLDAFTAISNITASRGTGLAQQLRQALQVGSDFLGLECAFVSQRQAHSTRVLELIADQSITLHPQQIATLEQLPSSLALNARRLLALNGLDTSDRDQQRCVKALHWQSYLGVPIYLHGELYGGLNFASSSVQRDFSQSEKLFMHLLERWVSSCVERDQALNALQLNEARFRSLFEMSAIGIALNDYHTGQFMELNNALVAPTGYSKDEFKTLSYFDVTPIEYQEQEMQQLLAMQTTGRYGPYEKEYIRKDGSRYPVLLNGMLLREQDGREVIWSMIEDITERRRNDRLKTEFLSTVSHELRTPLTALNGVLGLLASGTLGSINDKQQQMLTLASNNGKRLGLLINDLLDMDKLLAGKLDMTLKPHALQPLLAQAVADNQSYAKQHQVNLVLGDCDDHLAVRADALRLNQVLANLLSNAAKFSSAGQQVRLSAERQAERVVLSVQDQGCGIPLDFQPQIFSKFAQADGSDTRKKGGTGLGLAITKELVERMGGEIGFESTPNVATVFRVSLPVAHPEAQP